MEIDIDEAMIIRRILKVYFWDYPNLKTKEEEDLYKRIKEFVPYE